MSTKLITEKEYIARINRIFDYIEKNLDKPFTLEELAEVANFSKYHFHRIFLGMVGETPFQFLLRVRLEKAASALIMHPQEKVADIAFRCGFSDSSIFSRSFKQYFQIPPTEYRRAKNSNQDQEVRKEGQSEDGVRMYFCFDSKTIKWKTNMEQNKSVEVKHLPKTTVAYLRHIGPYKGDSELFGRLFNQLFSWAGPRGLLAQPHFQPIVIYHDDPSITDESKHRISVCLTVPEDTLVDGELGLMEIEEGKYVVARFVVAPTEFEKAWNWVFGEWFPSSGYQPDDKPCFEAYPEPAQDGNITVDICVPVKPI